MKVAFLGSAKSIHIQRWSEALRDRGIQIDQVSLDYRQDAHRLRIPPPHGYFLNALALRSWLAKQKPDILHAHYASGYGTLARLASFSPTLLSVWGSDVYEYPYRSLFTMRNLQKNLHAADALASTSNSMADQVRLLVPNLKKDIAITPFRVDTAKFSPSADNSSRPITIGTVKTLDPRYGIDTLLLALAKLFPVYANVRGLIVGDGPQRTALMKLAERLRIANRVEFRPAVPHRCVPALLAELDIFVAASRIESFGVAVIEASSCGKPVVVSDAGGLPEVVIDGETGMVVPAENESALANALSRLIESPAQRAKLGVAGRSHVLRTYEWSGCVDKMVELYQSVIEGKTSTMAA